jgi:hypothetical protein
MGLGGGAAPGGAGSGDSGVIAAKNRAPPSAISFPQGANPDGGTAWLEFGDLIGGSVEAVLFSPDSAGRGRRWQGDPSPLRCPALLGDEEMAIEAEVFSFGAPGREGTL